MNHWNQYMHLMCLLDRDIRTSWTDPAYSLNLMQPLIDLPEKARCWVGDILAPASERVDDLERNLRNMRRFSDYNVQLEDDDKIIFFADA